MHNVLKTSKHRLGEGAETEDMCKLQRRAPGRHKDDAELQSDERYSFGYEFGTSILKPDGATEAPLKLSPLRSSGGEPPADPDLYGPDYSSPDLSKPNMELGTHGARPPHTVRLPAPSLKQGRIEAAQAAKEAERLRREEERLQVQAEGRAARKAAAGARGRGAPPRASRSSSARSAQPARGPKSNLPTHGAHAIPCPISLRSSKVCLGR